jgi:hypothetical protein
MTRIVKRMAWWRQMTSMEAKQNLTDGPEGVVKFSFCDVDIATSLHFTLMQIDLLRWLRTVWEVLSSLETVFKFISMWRVPRTLKGIFFSPATFLFSQAIPSRNFKQRNHREFLRATVANSGAGKCKQLLESCSYLVWPIICDEHNQANWTPHLLEISEKILITESSRVKDKLTTVACNLFEQSLVFWQKNDFAILHCSSIFFCGITMGLFVRPDVDREKFDWRNIRRSAKETRTAHAYPSVINRLGTSGWRHLSNSIQGRCASGGNRPEILQCPRNSLDVEEESHCKIVCVFVGSVGLFENCECLHTSSFVRLLIW